jgi:hypothetical protein
MFQLRLVRGTPDGNALTVPRLIQGSDNEAPRLCSDSHEARSATGKSPTRTTPGWYARPTLFTYSEIKSQSIQCNYLLPPTDMATAVTDVGATPVSVLTFYRPSRDGR